MSSRLIVTGRKMMLSKIPPVSRLYDVKGGTTNSIDNIGASLRYIHVPMMKEVDILYTSSTPYRDVPHVESLESRQYPL